mmetsp:Transcript_7276/g.22514  ORF Transcript_7276/g.22514 Transcript_7276/m.22514 type:complete len:88 (+) Transcript_7276:1045-1308(+)|eukprot:scaffold322535_cov39-Tisochrysis_lutea.AAC.3
MSGDTSGLAMDKERRGNGEPSLPSSMFKGVSVEALAAAAAQRACRATTSTLEARKKTAAAQSCTSPIDMRAGKAKESAVRLAATMPT